MHTEKTEKDLADSLNVPYEICSTTINKFKINYIVAGAGDPVLLIHGGNIGWGQWYETIPELSKNYKVFAIDLPGSGRSSKVDYSLIDTEKDFVEVVEKFMSSIITKPVHLVGNSFGGWIAIRLSLLRPKLVSSLILSDSIGFTSSIGIIPRILSLPFLAQVLIKTVLHPRRSNNNIYKFLEGVMYNKAFVILKEFIEYFYVSMQRSHNLLFLTSLTSPFGFRKELLIMDKLKHLKVRTLIIWGKYSSALPLKNSIGNFSKVRDCTVEIIDKSDHMPFIERPDEFNKKLLSFLQQT